MNKGKWKTALLLLLLYGCYKVVRRTETKIVIRKQETAKLLRLKVAVPSLNWNCLLTVEIN